MSPDQLETIRSSSSLYLVFEKKNVSKRLCDLTCPKIRLTKVNYPNCAWTTTIVLRSHYHDVLEWLMGKLQPCRLLLADAESQFWPDMVSRKRSQLIGDGVTKFSGKVHFQGRLLKVPFQLTAIYQLLTKKKTIKRGSSVPPSIARIKVYTQNIFSFRIHKKVMTKISTMKLLYWRMTTWYVSQQTVSCSLRGELWFRVRDSFLCHLFRWELLNYHRNYNYAYSVP